MENKGGVITITNREMIVLTGVEKVNSAGANTITLVQNKSPLTINGKDLFVQKLDIENHMLEVVGKIDSLKYSGEKIPFLKRILK